MNKNQEYVKQIDGQIMSLQINKPEGWEGTVSYLQMALTDVMGRLSAEELAEVRASQTQVMSAEEAKVRRAEEAKEMANNRDKPSI
jgi:hypothetical protein